jgi:hypothetical protein
MPLPVRGKVSPEEFGQQIVRLGLVNSWSLHFFVFNMDVDILTVGNLDVNKRALYTWTYLTYLHTESF